MGVKAEASWTEAVHENRLAKTLELARVQRKSKKAGRPAPRSSDAPLTAVAGMAAALVGAVWIKHNRERIVWRLARWKELPVVRQFVALVAPGGGGASWVSQPKAPRTTKQQPPSASTTTSRQAPASSSQPQASTSKSTSQSQSKKKKKGKKK